MAAQLIDGNALAARIREQVSTDAADLRARGRPVCLAAILIGDDLAAGSYARSQSTQTQNSGIDYRLLRFPATTPMSEALETIDRLNADPLVSGIMLHLPVPKPLDGFALQQRITANKDVEGVSAANLGLMVMGREALVPCTAAAAFACLQATGVEIRGKRAVVVGRSVIVGKPLAMLLLGANATVTQCHTQTRDLPAHTRSGEILMVAAGKAGLIGAEHVAPGAIVIDVGTHRVGVTTGGTPVPQRQADGTPVPQRQAERTPVPQRQADGTQKTITIGDVRFNEVAAIASHLTPVPGGVGPVTVAMLLANTVAAARCV